MNDWDVYVRSHEALFYEWGWHGMAWYGGYKVFEESSVWYNPGLRKELDNSRNIPWTKWKRDTMMLHVGMGVSCLCFLDISLEG